MPDHHIVINPRVTRPALSLSAQLRRRAKELREGNVRAFFSVSILPCDASHFGRKYATQDEGWNPRTAATQLLSDICRLSARSLTSVVSMCSKSLENYAKASWEEQNHSMKEGVIFALGSLHVVVKTRQKQLSRILDILEEHAVPDFTRPVHNLRASACWVFSQYSKCVSKRGSLYDDVLGKVSSTPGVRCLQSFFNKISPRSSLTVCHL